MEVGAAAAGTGSNDGAHRGLPCCPDRRLPDHRGQFAGEGAAAGERPGTRPWGLKHGVARGSGGRTMYPAGSREGRDGGAVNRVALPTSSGRIMASR